MIMIMIMIMIIVIVIVRRKEPNRDNLFNITLWSSMFYLP